MEYIVSSCNNCPLCKIDFGLKYHCGHPSFDDYYLMLDVDEKDYLITPDICPLNDYPLMLKNKKWQKMELFLDREN
jgi:hypothetical protein